MRLTTRWLVAMLLLLAFPAHARDEIFAWGHAYGTCDLLDSPIVFEGGFEFGIIEDGYWSVEIPDDGWPTDADERFEYIWSTFFAPNYHGHAEMGPSYWTGLLHVDHGLSDLVQWRIQDDTNGGSVGGFSPGVAITVIDWNGNGILEAKEFSGLLPMAMLEMQALRQHSEGCYYSHCGVGNAFWNWEVSHPGLHGRCYGGFYLWLDWCHSVHPRDEASWGTIKAMFR